MVVTLTKATGSFSVPLYVVTSLASDGAFHSRAFRPRVINGSPVTISYVQFCTLLLPLNAASVYVSNPFIECSLNGTFEMRISFLLRPWLDYHLRSWFLPLSPEVTLVITMSSTPLQP